MTDTIETSEANELNLVDRVYRSTRAAIVDGTYAPDARLRLNTLARENDVSLIPVREALRLLERERLVIATPNKGARVAPVSLTCLTDLYRVRKIVEVEAIRLAAPKLRKDSITTLRELVDEMVARFDVEDDKGFLALHRDFHFGIYDLSGSDWLRHIIEILWGHADRYVRLAVRHSILNGLVQDDIQRTSVEDIGNDHHSILDKLEEDDIDGAAAAVISDLDGTINRIRNAISEGLVESEV